MCPLGATILKDIVSPHTKIIKIVRAILQLRASRSDHLQVQLLLIYNTAWLQVQHQYRMVLAPLM